MTEQSEQTEEMTKRRIPPLAYAGAALVVLVLLALLLGRSEARPLKPSYPTATPGEITLSEQAILVTFDELNANPGIFQNQRIRITGKYMPLPRPDCFDTKGPVIAWALIKDNLQLNGWGFEQIIRLVPENTTLTVEGVWRLYEGVVGCGKVSNRGLVWYLQVERIVFPNPLPNFGLTSVEGTPDSKETVTPPNGDDSTPVDETATAVPLPTALGEPTGTVTATRPTIPTVTSSPTVTPTPDSNAFTPTPTNTRPSEPPGEVTASPTSTPTNSPVAGSATATLPARSTPGTASPTTPPITTSTPGPTFTPGPSPTTDSYPGPPDTATPDDYPDPPS